MVVRIKELQGLPSLLLGCLHSKVFFRIGKQRWRFPLARGVEGCIIVIVIVIVSRGLSIVTSNVSEGFISCFGLVLGRLDGDGEASFIAGNKRSNQLLNRLGCRDSRNMLEPFSFFWAEENEIVNPAKIMIAKKR